MLQKNGSGRQKEMIGGSSGWKWESNQECVAACGWGSNIMVATVAREEGSDATKCVC